VEAAAAKEDVTEREVGEQDEVGEEEILLIMLVTSTHVIHTHQNIPLLTNIDLKQTHMLAYKHMHCC